MTKNNASTEGAEPSVQPPKSPPDTETLAGAIVREYLRSVPRGSDEFSKSIRLEKASKCSRAHFNGPQRVAALIEVMDGTVSSKSPSMDESTVEAVVIALSCWGLETRRNKSNSDTGFDTMATSLNAVRLTSGLSSAVTRTVNSLARVGASTVKSEMLRASSLVAAGRGSYNHAYLADDIYRILTNKGLPGVRSRFAVEYGTRRIQRG